MKIQLSIIYNVN